MSESPLVLAKTYDVCKAKEPKLTVVLIHGIASNSGSFNGLLEYLENEKLMNDIRFVAFDLLGAGKSSHSNELEYSFEEQLEALDNSIDKLGARTPLVIIAHSMGTMIAARYVDKRPIAGLILVSPPIYREDEVKNPIFKKAMDGFCEVVARKNSDVVKTKAFKNEIQYIIPDPKNYSFFEKINCPTTIIYGELDKIIAPLNIPKVAKNNSNIHVVKTVGAHSVTPDKYNKIVGVLKKYLKEAENETV